MRNKAGRKALRERRTVLLAAGAALALGLLAACAPRQSQPVVTEDDLTPPSAAQNAIELDAGNGRNYAYDWPAGDVEATMARTEEEEKSYFKEMDEWLARAEQMTPEELAEAGFASIEQAREQHRMIQAHQTEKIASYREYLEKQAALDPVVSPQEAANRAGALFEQFYGVDLSEDVLQLECYETQGDTLLDPERTGPQRPIWAVTLRKIQDPDTENNLSCTMDATTGEILFTDYTASGQEIEARRELPHPASFEQFDGYAAGTGRWNADDPSFAPLVEEAERNLERLLSGSVLTAGARVTQVRGDLTEYDGGENTLWFSVSCDNGRRYRIAADMRYDPLGPDGTQTPFPMRGFRVWSDAD